MVRAEDRSVASERISTAPPPAPARRRILDAALRCFAQEGVLAATLEDVRQEARTSVGAVYHHFADKQALHAAVFADVLATYQEAFLEVLEEHADPRDGVREAVLFHLRWCAAHGDGTRILLAGRPAGADEAVRELNRVFFRRVQAWWRGHAHHGALRELPAPVLHALWLGPATELARHAASGDGRRPSAAEAGVLADAAWEVLRAR